MRQMIGFFMLAFCCPAKGMTCLEKFLRNTQITTEEGYNPIAMATIGTSFLTSSILNATSDEWGMPTLVGGALGTGTGYIGGAPSVREVAKQKAETFVLETVGTLLNAQFTRTLPQDTRQPIPGFAWSATIEQAGMGALAGMIVGKTARYSWKGIVFCMHKLMHWAKESYTGKIPHGSETPAPAIPGQTLTQTGAS